MIELKNIRIGYQNIHILDKINFTIPSGAKILLNSPSGTGKTSFFRLLLGFLQPTEGEVSFDGVKLTPMTVKSIRNRIGYLSQETELPSGKVQDVIQEIFSYKANKATPFPEKALQEVFNLLELDPSTWNKGTDELSGGERQRLLVAILLLLDREFYLLDEPTSALDEKLKVKVRDLFLNRSATVFIISHDKQWLDSDKVALLNWTQDLRYEYGQ